MLLELQSDGTAVVTRGTTFQGQSGNTFIIGTFTTTPITPVANMVMEYNITRPDNEQSGWQPMNKVASELRWYYGLQGWDTTVSGTAKVALRWYDVSLATPVYTVTQEYDMIIKKGVIAQPVGIDDENYNTLIALIPALQTNKMDFYDISSPELLPPAVDYAEDGIKTANAFYYPFEKTVNLYNSTDTLATSGTLYVTKNDTAMRQYEYLFAGNGKNIDSPQIFTRQITYDSEGAVTSVGSFRQVDTDVYIGLKQVTDAIEADITSLQSTKQDKTDTDLETTDKTVVGAINELNTNKLNKNFSALVERTYLQLQDWVALQSEGGNYKTSIQTLKAYLTQGLVGLSFDILDELPSTGMENIIYLIPLSDSIVHVTDYASLPETGTADILYITDDDGARYQWDTDTSSYITYSLGYEEYIWLEETSAYELIGSTQIDLSGYATQLWVSENYVTQTDFNVLDGEVVKSISLNGETPITPTEGNVDLTVGGKKYATVVIGTTVNGHTAADVDYLCEGGSVKEVIEQILTDYPYGVVIHFLAGTYYIKQYINFGTYGYPVVLEGENETAVDTRTTLYFQATTTSYYMYANDNQLGIIFKDMCIAGANSSSKTSLIEVGYLKYLYLINCNIAWTSNKFTYWTHTSFNNRLDTFKMIDCYLYTSGMAYVCNNSFMTAILKNNRFEYYPPATNIYAYYIQLTGNYYGYIASSNSYNIGVSGSISNARAIITNNLAEKSFIFNLYCSNSTVANNVVVDTLTINDNGTNNFVLNNATDFEANITTIDGGTF